VCLSVRACVHPTRQFRVLMDRRNWPGRSDSENGNRPGQSDSKNGNRSGLRTGGQTRQGGAGGQGAGQGRAGGSRKRGSGERAARQGRAGAPTGDFTVAFGHGHPLVWVMRKDKISSCVIL
jgi:hypothetical protein